MTSSLVLAPTCDRSQRMPSRFISATTTAAEIGQATVLRFIAAGADQVLGVVGQLDDADAQLLEQAEIADLVLDAGDILPAEMMPVLPSSFASRCPRWCRPA